MGKQKKSIYAEKRSPGTAACVHGIVLGLAAFLLATAIGLGVICITDWPYTRDVAQLGIAAESGLTEPVILRNYRAVIDYLSPFSRDGFSLPDLKWSADGAAHFADCKTLFLIVYAVGLLAFIVCVVYGIKTAKRRLDRGTLAISSGVTIAIPVAVLLAMAIDFDKAFTIFHTIFFPGRENWLFDPATDPIINILPEEFFLHAALVIAAFWVIFAAAQLILHILLSRRKG